MICLGMANSQENNVRITFKPTHKNKKQELLLKATQKVAIQVASMDIIYKVKGKQSRYLI